MKCQIPEISWHNRDPVLSVDFQPKVEGGDDAIRLASAGSDSHVLIWHLLEEDGTAHLDLVSDLTRHQKAVNCVRWSPNGKFLASCDDESFIFIWHQKPDTEAMNIFDRDDNSDYNKEIWLSYKTLRGHREDIYDLSFSPDSQFIISGSVDNTAMIWDIEKGKSVAILSDHKGFVQGVAWDPLNQYLATLATDRYFRVFDANNRKIVQRNFKSELPVTAESPFYQKSVRLFHNDTLQTFFRRLTFSPDGQLIVVPSGLAEIEEPNSERPLNTTYIYTRYSMGKPALVLPSPDQYTVAVRFCPMLFELRDIEVKPIIPLPYRMIFAVATKCSVYLYDTQQKLPFGLISNIHYTRLTDMTWSYGGKVLLVSSTDGYCSIVQFSDGELGKVYKDQNIQEILNEKMHKNEMRNKKKPAKKIETPKVAENEEQMEVDDNLISTLPESIKEIIPVEKIIKSNENFSPEKQTGLPVTPIQIRKCPRPPTELNKTPNRIEVRHFPRTFTPTRMVNDEEVLAKPMTESPMDRKISDNPNSSPRTPGRRVELFTLTPKSKKKLL